MYINFKGQKHERTTNSLAKCGLDNYNINFCFTIVLQLLGVTELYSSKNFILNFKPAYRQAGKKSTTVRADGMLLPAIRQAWNVVGNLVGQSRIMEDAFKISPIVRH